MIPVREALDHLFALVSPLDIEQVPLAEAARRVLARDVKAVRDQPPFAASAMDGYAIGGNGAAPGARFNVIGEAAAGHGFAGVLGAGDAVRIFTGAPLPRGATRVVMQEDVTREGACILLGDRLDAKDHVRPAGSDFRVGDTMDAPRVLRPADVALLASMNHACVPVRRRPEVALIATGDELVMPGEDPGPDQIIASNGFGLKALLEEAGAHARLLPIARDSVASLTTAFDLAKGADLIVTIGGASVGDHDLVGRVAGDLGMDRAFYKVAMRPGKPLMAGKMGGAAMVGLPGNPVSAMVCGHVFAVPMITAMLGLGAAPAPRRTARLAAALPANGPREHYMRARLTPDGLVAESRQDSALLGVLATADALLVRAVEEPARAPGDMVEYIPV
jgi:molybdopterin molybdotransferase